MCTHILHLPEQNRDLFNFAFSRCGMWVNDIVGDLLWDADERGYTLILGFYLYLSASNFDSPTRSLTSFAPFHQALKRRQVGIFWIDLFPKLYPGLGTFGFSFGQCQLDLRNAERTKFGDMKPLPAHDRV
jgi:hypothetical protein